MFFGRREMSKYFAIDRTIYNLKFIEELSTVDLLVQLRNPKTSFNPRIRPAIPQYPFSRGPGFPEQCFHRHSHCKALT